jgi:pyruvate/2-oxoglutarate dehydrogenase complex dihydrolipoamide dehydrogenase (E3) component
MIGHGEKAMPQSFDAIFIGAGQSGPFLAARLAGERKKVLLVEREHLGGTCVNNGCIPTKSLVASARVAHMARRAADFGVNAGPVTVDMKKVKARKDSIVNDSVTGLGAWLGNMENLTLLWGSAKFTGPHEITVNGATYTAPEIFLNTGGRPTAPDWPGASEVKILDNISMMDLDILPEHLIVVGGSYIGLEFAQMYRRFGSRVTVLEHGPRLVSREDADISDAIAEILRSEDVALHLGVGDFAVKNTATGGIALSVTVDGKPLTINGSHLLAATGRKPNVEDLDIAKAGIALDKRGYIAVDDQLRTNVEGIWALGDVNGRGAFTHTSYNDFEVVGANLIDADPRRVTDRPTTYALYIDPPLGRVGMTETEVRASGKKALIATRPMTRVGRAHERSETQGFMKVLVDADSKLVLGASLLGIECDEVVHLFIDNMAAKQPYTAISRTMHIHPTVSELIPTLLQDLKPLV